EIIEVHLTDELRAGKDQVLVAALIGLSAEVFGVQIGVLEQRAHRAVEHQHAFGERSLERGDARRPALGVLGGRGMRSGGGGHVRTPVSRKTRKWAEASRAWVRRSSREKPSVSSSAERRSGSKPR